MFKRILSKIKWWLEESDTRSALFGTNIRHAYRTIKGSKMKEQNH